MLLYLSYILTGLIVFIAIGLSIRTSILRNAPNTKYSLAKVHLMWWTMIIATCFIIHFGRTGSIDIINSSTLILLGISVTTLASGSIIDLSQQEADLIRHQTQASKGLIIDILSDSNGVSMHRFQGVLFNVIFGLSFLIIFWQQDKFPVFSSSELALIGLSSGAYLALKTNENKTTSVKNIKKESITTT